MRRLIDAEALKKDILSQSILGETMGKVLDRYIHAVDSQTTVFDVDKVVEQLKTMRMRYYLTYANTGNKTNDEVWEKVSRAVDKAIEIVKGGGADAN